MIRRALIALVMVKSEAKFFGQKTCQLVKFEFQIDKWGQPWLTNIMSDGGKRPFFMKTNIYDQFKRMLAIEMTSLLSKKVRWAHKQEQVKEYGR